MGSNRAPDSVGSNPAPDSVGSNSAPHSTAIQCEKPSETLATTGTPQRSVAAAASGGSSSRAVQTPLSLRERASSPGSARAVGSGMIKTPARAGRVLRSVSVVRGPAGAGASGAGRQDPVDRVGIGISFGITAKGDVFITRMAPGGPAESSGHIRRGDQLLAVDTVDIRGWTVEQIVRAIVGPPGSTVTLDLATLPAEFPSPQPSPANAFNSPAL